MLTVGARLGCLGPRPRQRPLGIGQQLLRLRGRDLGQLSQLTGDSPEHHLALSRPAAARNLNLVVIPVRPLARRAGPILNPCGPRR
jgi:hypothetical protein